MGKSLSPSSVSFFIKRNDNRAPIYFVGGIVVRAKCNHVEEKSGELA